MRTLAILVLASAAVVAAPVPKEVAKRPPLEGTWRITGKDCRGIAHTISDGQRWEFGAASLKIHPQTVVNDPAFVQTCQGTYALDPGGRIGEFDFFDTGSLGTSPGLYAFEGASLKICFVIGAGRRPVDLKPGTDKVICTFDRVKE